MTHQRRAASLVLAACVLILCGCASRGPVMEPSAAVVELVDTPFFPQEAHQCGPAALATVLGASRVAITPEELEQRVYLPGRRGSLQVEMQATPRAYARLGYQVEPELADITAQLDAGRPVLVLHNYGLSFWPRWHYAVVVGYDGPKQQLLLRSGKVQRQVLSAKNFMRAWDNADRWGFVVLAPGELPAAADKERYLEAAAAFEPVAKPRDAWSAFDAAVRQWPDEAVARVGRGTASYRSMDYRAAAADYRAALQIDATQTGARNNLAMTLLELGCVAEARRQIDSIDATALDARMRDEIADTRSQIDGGTHREACSPGALP
jgi:tetratricopeptide (TPR) repeat protein